MNASITTTAEGFSRDDELFGHPKGLYVCFATELWERFSFYGMKYLLLLYLTKYHLFSTFFFFLIVFAFGLAFEVPIATVLVVWTGLTTLKKLGKARPYVFLGAFIVGMLLTPPDIISQTLLAVPVYLLYEIGILMARVFAIKEKKSGEEAQPAE